MATISRSYTDYQKLKNAYERIYPARVAAVIDLNACFAAAANGCNFAGYFAMQRNQIMEKIWERSRDGMFQDALPARLAKPKTGANLKAEWDLDRDRVEKTIAGIKDPVARMNYQLLADSALAFVDKNTRFSVMYLGDFLDIVEEIGSPGNKLKLDAILSHTESAAGVLEALRTVHDYSEYSSDRPPPPPRKPPKTEEPASWLPGLSPVGSAG